jgi:signal peptidase I
MSTGPDVPETAPKRKPSRLRSLAELILTVAVAIGLALLVQAFLVKPYKIPSGSMIPTLAIHQRILVNRLSTHPGLGDVVVFHPPAGALEPPYGVCGDKRAGLAHGRACDRTYGAESSQTYVKRVVGLPGDHLRIVAGRVLRNGARERGSYIQRCTTPSFCDFPTTITVPAGHYFMMGDNRNESDDSRFWGPIPQSWIIGTAFFTYWPLDRIGLF